MTDRTSFLYLSAKLILFCEQNGIPIIETCFDRSHEEQMQDLAKGTSTVRHSRHEDWCAIDLAVLDWNDQPIWKHDHGDTYEKMGDFWKTLGPRCRWGGDFHKPGHETEPGWDPYHFELARQAT